VTLSALVDKAHEPTDEDVSGVLGPAYAAWTRLID
jgi:hypothetical protein